MFKISTSRGEVRVGTHVEAIAIQEAFRSLLNDWDTSVTEERTLNGVFISPNLCFLLDKVPSRTPAIKYLRELTGCGLKEGKDFVDSCQTGSL